MNFREIAKILDVNGAICQLNVQGLASLAIDLSVPTAFTGTLIFEYTINGTVWRPFTVNVGQTTSTATGATGAGVWSANVAAYSAVRIKVSAYTSGSLLAFMRAIDSGGASSGGGSSSGIVYNATPPTLTDGQTTAAQSDVKGNTLVSQGTAFAGEDLPNNVLGTQNKPVASATYSATGFGIFGTDVDLSVKASPGNLFGIIATNASAVVKYLQLHNKVSAPTSTNVPVLSLPIPAGTANNPGMLSLDRSDFGPGGKYFSLGIAIGISTAEATFTAATTTDHDYYGEYI